MNISDKQKPQVIALCCLAVVLLGYGVYRLLGTGTQAAPPAKQAQETTAVSAPDAQAAAQAAPQVVVAENVTVTSRDPFAPQVGPRESLNVQSSRALRTTITPLNNMPRIPFFDLKPITAPSAPRPVAMASVPTEDPLQDLKVTGVIIGATNVAIIRGPDGERHYVREGDTIGGKYRIEMISRLGVNVRSGSRITVLRLGGNDGVRDRVKA